MNLNFLLVLLLLFPLSIHADNGALSPNIGDDECIDITDNDDCDTYAALLLVNGIVINEINYRSPVNQQNIDFIEIYNNASTAVNLSGWTLTSGINYNFPTGTTISAGGYLVIAADPGDVQSQFGISALGPYIGNLNSMEEEVILRNASGTIIDEVEYHEWKEWPAVRHLNNGDSPASIQKMNPRLVSKHAGSWNAAAPTPKAANNAVFQNNPSNLPIVKSIDKSPDNPTSSDVVRIKADIKNLEVLSGFLYVNLEYQVVAPGSYIKKSSALYNSNWQTLIMRDDGLGADSTANNGVYTVEIPASVQVHRRLVRYRVKVTTSNGFNETFPDQNHTESNYAYYVYDGYKNFNGYSFANVNEMQDITVLATSSDVNTYIGDGGTNAGQYTGKDFLGEGTLIYNGKVYDHIRFRPRGGANRRYLRKKPGIKFDMNPENCFAPEDDCGKKYNAPRSKIMLSGTWVNDVASHGLTESLIYKINELSGDLPRGTDYTQLRIVDSSTETGNSGDFWGVFLLLEDYNGSYLNEHDLGEGNFWNTDRITRDRVLDYQGNFPNSGSIPTFAPQTQSSGTFTVNSNGNLPRLFSNRAANEIYGLNGNNYIGKHSYSEFYSADLQKYHGWWGDMDNTFGSPNDDVTTFARASSNVNAPLDNDMIIPASMLVGYHNTLRSVYDLLLNTEQRTFLVDAESAKIYNPSAAYDWTTLDKSRWNQTYDLGNIDAHVTWYKTWLRNRRGYITTSVLDDTNIPTKPTINMGASTAINQLTFTTSSFADPQGAGTFGAIEWRVGEWSDPSNPFYNNICEPIYEIEDKWTSGEITLLSSTYTIPYTAQLEPGRTYKVRVRHKDNTGRWSHWSEPKTFVAQPPANPYTPDIVINEIMYNELDCGAQFIELKNTESSTVDLSSYTFTDGINYTFPSGASLFPGATLVLAKDAQDFTQKYGFAPYGEFGGSLNISGERLELQGWYSTIVDSLTYNNKNPWDEHPEDKTSSLELLDPSSDNSDPLNWFRSDTNCGTPRANNSRVCTGTADNIVINEINYNSDNANFDPGDWVELYNPSSIITVNLSGWTFYDNGAAYVLPQGTYISPGGYLVLVEDAGTFSAAFPSVSNSLYIGNLGFSFSNKGERLSLFDENKCLSDYVVYDDATPWPLAPDGGGSTLALTNTNLDNALAGSWRASNSLASGLIHGSPGATNLCVPGQACNDGDPCTTLDALDANCNCVGLAVLDSDSDGFCDAVDQCPNFNDNLIGTPCSDGDPCTAGETYDANCGCSGGIFQDQDNDGICDAQDPCNNNLTGTACSDDDPCTTGETYDANCNCTGGTFADADNDGVCDANDVCPTLNNNLFSQPCNDNNPNTIYDHYNSNTCGCSGISSTITVCVSINNILDDLEEYTLDGTVDINSTDLEMAQEPNNANQSQIVGLRFNNIAVPQGATITNSTIQFTTDEIGSTATNLTIKAEAVNHATAFTGGLNNISTRPTTFSSASWSPPAWNAIGESGVNQRTPNIASVIQEVVNRSGYQQGNSLAILITGSGTRTAESYDGSPTQAAELCISYETDQCVLGYPCNDNDPNTINDVFDANCDCVGEDAGLSAKVLLEGFYESATGKMHTKLKDNNLLPLAQPYNVAPWNYTGTESVTSIPADVVDWVLVMSRDANGNILDQSAGFVDRDGNLLKLDGSQAIIFNNAQGNYFSVHHRSHLAIMSANPYAGGVYNFTTSAAQAQGNQQLKLVAGKYMLYGGDYDGNGIVNSSDFNDWKIQGAVLNQYLPIDGDGNTIVNAADYNLWINNRSKVGEQVIRY